MKSCFGTIYPDLQQVDFGKRVNGKVFQIFIDTRGPGHRERKLDIDLAAWEDCRRCEDFQDCYQFSSARLEVQQALLCL
jgi:hypothetical protein